MLVVMVLQLNYDEVRNALHDAGYWFGAIIVLWAALYVLNTTCLLYTSPSPRD